MVLSVQVAQRPLQTSRAVFSWYSSVMLTPSENLILSHFHFSVFFDLTYHNITDAKLVPRKLKSSMIYSWMTSLTSAFRTAEVPDSLFWVPCSCSFMYLYWNAPFEWVQVSNWCELFCTAALCLLLFTICQSWGGVSCILWWFVLYTIILCQRKFQSWMCIQM